MTTPVFAGALGLIFLLLVLCLGRWLWRESRSTTDDLVELFELRERMSNAAFHASVQRSVRGFAGPHR